MKILTTSFLMLVMSMTTLMTTTVFAIEKESEVTTKSEMHKGSGHKEKMDTHMKMMKIQMQAIHEETDPEKRKVLMQAHRQSMHEGMKMMHGKGGHGMMHGKKHKGMKGKTEEMSAHARMQHMEHRMDSMHMMMEQMMQHEDAMHQHSKH
jgi:hypothetical protein